MRQKNQQYDWYGEDEHNIPYQTLVRAVGLCLLSSARQH